MITPRTRLLVGLLALAVWGQGPAMASADEKPPGAAAYVCPICHLANNQDAPYGQKAGATLARGAANTAFGWTELLLQPTAEVKANGNLLMGLGKGVGFAITRTGAGLGELFTFWVPRGKDGYLSLTKTCPICLQPVPSAPADADAPAPQKPVR